MFERALKLPRAGTETFFLWGPRQTGKTTLLRQTYGDRDCLCHGLASVVSIIWAALQPLRQFGLCNGCPPIGKYLA